jgi:histidine triad (HIT) family protein
MKCAFCEIINGTTGAHLVHEDENALAFLDVRPLFPGHVLLVPREHVETLADLPASQVTPIFLFAQRLATAVETAMQAEGTFVAINNRVSQSVPHLHIHVVPRRKGDGMRGFFWPRSKYTSEDRAREVAATIRAHLLP